MSMTQRPTALITGASSGIGLAVATRLARDGFAVVLVARSADRLQALARSLESSTNTHATVVTQDLSCSGCGARLQRQVAALGIDVDVLVNSAGMGTYGRFAELPVEREISEIALNASALVEVTRAFLPAMTARGRGAIINIASMAAFQPVPYMAVYGATKAFVLSFTMALRAELVQSGVHVTAICPSAVETPFIAQLGSESLRNTAAFSKPMSPDRVASAVALAIHSGASTRVVGLKNKLLACAVRFLPPDLVAAAVERMLRPSTRPASRP